MADIDLKTETPDASIDDSAVLFGADSQASASPSVYSMATVRGHIAATANTFTATQTFTPAVNTSALVGSGYSLTGSASASFVDLAGTWNTTGTPTAIKLNITDTASPVASASSMGSLLINLQKTNYTYFGVGNLNASIPALWLGGANGNSGTQGSSNYVLANNAGGLQVNSPGANNLWLTLINSKQVFLTQTAFNVSSSSSIRITADINSNGDTILTRRGAANLRLGAADAAGSAIAISSVASNQLTLASNHGLTTGAAVIITGTAAPSGASLNTLYYARNISAAVLELYATYDQALNTASTTGRIAVTTAGTSASINRATPFQQLSVQSFTGTDIPGQPFVITGSQGTGTGAGGSIIFQVAPAGTTGSTQNALQSYITINPTRGSTSSPAGVPTLAFTNDGGNGLTGIGTPNTGQMFFYTGGIISFRILNQLVQVPSSFEFGWNSNSTFTGDNDLRLFRDAANTLALRNGTNAQEQRVYGSFTSATNFQRMSIKTLRESSGALSGATYVSTIAIPAYAVPVGVTTRVTTAITGATSYDVGDGTDADLWGNDIDITLGSQSRTADFTAIAAVDAAATARTVTLTANGSNFTGGVVEICVHYLTTEAD